MTNPTETEDGRIQIPTFLDVCAEWHKAAEKAHTFNRLVTTEAKIAQTPKELVWTLNKAKLYRYVPVVPEEERKPIPLLMVFAIMNRPHVLDLRPGHSFVEYMLRHGYDLYLLDWGAPGPEDKDLKFDDYALEYLPRAIRKLKVDAGVEEFSMLGWCLGALITTLYASLRPDDGLKNLILLTAPLDFTDKSAGGFTRWTSAPEFNADLIVEKLGNVPGAMIDAGAKMLKPVENYLGSYLMLWDNIDNEGTVEGWHAMNTWVRDTIPMAGAAYQQLINDFYKENRLVEGKLTLRGEHVQLSRLTANVLNIIADADHITPPCQSEQVMDLFGSEDKEICRVRGGHIGIMAGREPRRTLGHTSNRGWQTGRVDREPIARIMVNWEFLIDETAIASVLPAEYVSFSRPIRDALSVFLDGLPAPHQTAILAEQSALPSTASISRRLAVLARCCPALHKLGQILARDQRLPLELRVQLQQLESFPSSVPEPTIEEILTRELGPLPRLGVTLQYPAIAEASVAVVIGFQRSVGADLQSGVFKLLKPGIELRLDQELQLTERVGEHLDQRCDDLRIPHLDYRNTFQQVREKLRLEVQLDSEQRNQSAATAFYADEPRVQIPQLFELCTSRVTAMERVTGGKVTDHSLPSASQEQRLAELVVEALVTRPIFSRDREALFHCDPHAGNLFFTDEQRLAILDWSLTGRLGNEERIAIVQILLGAVSFDADQIVRTLAGLADQPPDLPALQATAENALRRIRQGQLPGLRWLVTMLDEAVQSARLRVAADLLLFRKTLYTLDGVLLDLKLGGGQLDRVLLDEFLRHFLAEWPRRWVTLPNSREFATRLSNRDLTRWLLGLPKTTARLYAGQIRDLLTTNQLSASASN